MFIITVKKTVKQLLIRNTYNMKKLLLLLFVFLSAAYSLKGQDASDGLIHGTVVDENDMPVPNASIALYEAENESAGVVTGTASGEDGSFELEASAGSYVVRVTFISYTAYQDELELSGDETVDLGMIKLSPSTSELDEVEVRAERSSMQMNFDSRIFNVGQDIVSMGGSALDVLDNVPSITTDFEGNVSLRGNQGVQILINGRPSSLVESGTDALSTIPSSMISEVEIITNPSARYSAEGTAGIINIVLRDNANLGFNGSIDANTGHPQNHEIGANLNYHVNNINWFLGGNLEYESEPNSGERYQMFSSPDTTYIYNQSSESRDREFEWDLRFGADIYLPASQLLNFSVRLDPESANEEEDVIYRDFFIDPDVREQIDNQGPNSQIYPDEILQEVLRQEAEEARETDWDFRMQYEKKFNDNSDHLLSAEIDYELTSSREDSDLEESIMGSQAAPLLERTSNTDDGRDLRMDVDYEQPLGENGRFEAGFRSSFEWLDNDYLVERRENGTWIELDEFNDSFNYHENVNALYTSLAGGFGSFSYQLGLRAEQTVIETELIQTGEKNDQNYLNLFPSFFLSYEFNERNSVQASYSRRLRRPWSRMLLPFANYSDSRNLRSGNPNLMPEFGNSYEAGYLRYWDTGSVLTSFYYRYRTDVFEDITIDEGDGINRRLPINLATEQAWGVEFTADQELFSGMQLLGSLNLYQSESEGVYEGQTLTSDGESFMARLRMRWRFLESWNAQASLMYRGAEQTTQGRENGSSFVNFGIAKELFGRRGTLSLSVRDLFNARGHDEVINDLYTYAVNDFQWSSRSARLTFRYNFSTTSQQGGGGGGRR